jgi:membrane fusion protein (multidrug efflux system)
MPPRAALSVLGLIVWLAPAEALADPPRVVVAEATEVSFPLTVEALGTARANESVEIRPRISRAITKIRFEEGQRVEAGTVLVELEDSELRAAVAAARANLATSEAELQRAKELVKTRALSPSEFDRRRAQRDADRAALDAALAQLADTRVRAPFEGRVGLRRVSLGALVSPDTVITTLDDTDPVKVDFDVPETALARLEEGLTVDARSAAWPETAFRGVVASIDTRVDPVSRTVTVRALVPNPDGRLRPGMLLVVKLLRENVAALVVPEQAIVPEQSRQYVLVVEDDGRVEKRLVVTGRRRPGQVEVLEGLAPGERVVAEGTQKARPGDPVEVSGRIEVAPAVPVGIAGEPTEGGVPGP